MSRLASPAAFRLRCQRNRCVHCHRQASGGQALILFFEQNHRMHPPCSVPPPWILTVNRLQIACNSRCWMHGRALLNPNRSSIPTAACRPTLNLSVPSPPSAAPNPQAARSALTAVLQPSSRPPAP
eukprot:358183-Chlamydomonas_euryale.AAC.2